MSARQLMELHRQLQLMKAARRGRRTFPEQSGLGEEESNKFSAFHARLEGFEAMGKEDVASGSQEEQDEFLRLPLVYLRVSEREALAGPEPKELRFLRRLPDGDTEPVTLKFIPAN